MKRSLDELCQKIHYKFENIDLLEKALRHRSAGKNNNERLEFIGDSILGFIISETLFSKYTDADEGSLTRKRAHLVKGDTLADIAGELQLGEYLSLGSGELKSGGFRRASILADAFEAVIGAVYLDGGIEPCQKLIDHIFAERLASLDELRELKDPKTRLQEMLQAKGMLLPSYMVASIEGNPPKQIFKVNCELHDINKTVIGEGGSRRKAEQDAASKAIEILARHG